MELLDFFKNSLNLKNISRQGWIDKLFIEQPESVADHSYSMAVMAMVISDLENYDSEKILKMVLLHDLAESKIGDFTPDQITKDKKEKIENNAFYEIIEKLPISIKSKYEKVWKEYLADKKIINPWRLWKIFDTDLLISKIKNKAKLDVEKVKNSATILEIKIY